jgi:hypothetical protein
VLHTPLKRGTYIAHPIVRVLIAIKYEVKSENYKTAAIITIIIIMRLTCVPEVPLSKAGVYNFCRQKTSLNNLTVGKSVKYVLYQVIIIWM